MINGLYSGSGEVLQNFQSSVINQHPAFVHIMTGYTDADAVKDSLQRVLSFRDGKQTSWRW